MAEAEEIGIIHGDLRAASLLCPESGDAFLVHPGLRAIVRPAEGYALADLAPEAYETLAPERMATGSPPTIASDIYACGCLWWQLLAGRSPLAGGNSLARLQAAHAARVPDIRRVAPDTPDRLWRAMADCLQRGSGRSPRQFCRIGPSGWPSQPARSGRTGQIVWTSENACGRSSVRSRLGRGGGSFFPPHNSSWR